MQCKNISNSLRALFVALCLVFTMAPSLLFGAEEDSLDLFEARQEQLVSTSRIPRPTSRVAENITVITAADIAGLNAHTLAEVLQTVPGIQLDYLRTPTTTSFFNIQGALNTTVLVLVDGIRQNDVDQNIAYLSLITVQQIERIEIIKGAASATWGSALGGVINIITKTPHPEKLVDGMLSGSIGSKSTADSRLELSGTADRLGYYLTAGNIHSDGFYPNTGTHFNNLYGKLVYTLPGNGTVTAGLSRIDTRQGMDEADTVNWGFVHDNAEYYHSNGFLKFSKPLGAKLTLDIDGYFNRQDTHVKWGGLDGLGAITFFNDFNPKSTTRGSNARLSWGDSQQSLVTGVEYAHVNASRQDRLSGAPPDYDLEWDRWAVYGNGSYTIGRLTVLPGLRWDRTGLSGDNTSYTLGATYQLTDSTTLRAYGADGFSQPSTSTMSTPLQKIKTLQVGFESGALPYIWLKGTYFYNTLRDSQSAGAGTITNQNRQGFEIEARTAPVLDTFLSGGYTYLYAKNTDTGERLQTNSDQAVPPYTVKLALNYYKADLGLRAVLNGNYVWWNSPAGYPSSSAGMIWDLNLNWKLKPASNLSPELFFSGRNLLNGVQTVDTTLYNNPKRWFEGGVRLNF